MGELEEEILEKEIYPEEGIEEYGYDYQHENDLQYYNEQLSLLPKGYVMSFLHESAILHYATINNLDPIGKNVSDPNNKNDKQTSSPTESTSKGGFFSFLTRPKITS